MTQHGSAMNIQAGHFSMPPTAVVSQELLDKEKFHKSIDKFTNVDKNRNREFQMN